MKNLKEITDRLSRDLVGHLSDCGPKDVAFLEQFGILQLTPIRNTADITRPRLTELEEMLWKAGIRDCEDPSLKDFVCLKDGLQIQVFIIHGRWTVGDYVLWKGNLLEPGDISVPDDVAYDPSDFHKYELYGTGYKILLPKPQAFDHDECLRQIKSMAYELYGDEDTDGFQYDDAEDCIDLVLSVKAIPEKNLAAGRYNVESICITPTSVQVTLTERTGEREDGGDDILVTLDEQELSENNLQALFDHLFELSVDHLLFD